MAHLEVGAETFGLERGPDDKLVHARGLLAPRWEAVLVDGEFILHSLDSVLVLKEQHLHTTPPPYLLATSSHHHPCTSPPNVLSTGGDPRTEP